MFGRDLLKAAELHVMPPPAPATRLGLASGTLEHACFWAFTVLFFLSRMPFSPYSHEAQPGVI